MYLGESFERKTAQMQVNYQCKSCTSCLYLVVLPHCPLPKHYANSQHLDCRKLKLKHRHEHQRRGDDLLRATSDIVRHDREVKDGDSSEALSAAA